MRKILVAAIILLINSVSYSQVQEAWLQIYNTPDNSSERPAGIAVDAAGNSHVLTGSWANPAKVLKYGPNGDFLWIADVGYSPAAITLDASGNVYVATDGFRIYKLNSSGSEVWVRTYGFGGTVGGYNEPAAIVLDNQGNVYVTGRADITQTRDGTDFGTVKFNNAGDFQWARTYNGAEPGTGEDYATGIALDAAGNIYVTGTSQLNGELDFATIKYDPSGLQQWVKRYDGVEGHQDFSGDIVIDANDNIYVAGTTEGELYSDDFWYMTDIALIKYNTSGDQQWVRLISAGTHDLFRNMLVDGTGNVFITSYYEITAPGTLRVSKINSTSVVQWSKNATPSVEGRGSYIARDGSGNVYVTGTTRGDDTYSDIVTIKFNTNGDQRWMKHFIGGRYGDDAKNAFLGVDANENVYMTCIHNGLTATRDDVITFKLTQCEIVCPQNITVNNDPGKCDAVVTYPSVTTTGYCGTAFTYSHPSGSVFPVGNTAVTVTSDETGASCSFTITVVDNEKPVITFCPPNKTVDMNTGVCYAIVDPGVATATDNCSVTVTGERSDGAALNANYPGGVTTIIWTATDPSGNTTTCTQTITVEDNEPPVVTGETASTYLLSPPNHTMRDVAIDYIISDNCTLVDTTISVTSNEPVNGTGDGDTDPDWIVVDKKNLKLRAERSANGSGRIYTITITATDAAGNTTIKTLEVSVSHNIKKPNSGQSFKVGSTVSFEGEFWDKPGNKHTAKWLIDGSTVAKATVTEPSGNKNGLITGSYKFTTPGVYKLQMIVTDQTGLTHYATTAGDLEAIVVIYDPNGGHTYGGGYFTSPAGALLSNSSSTGKASYGFAMNYFKNSTNPKGETQFEFKVGDFEFNALNFEYLVINKSMAQFKGIGKISGDQSGVGFTMTVVDGQLDGTGIDKIRMKIYNKNNGQIIYDNQHGVSDAALPTQAIGSNSIIVIGGGAKQAANNSDLPVVRIEANELTERFEVGAFPNPHEGTFSLRIQSPRAGKMIIEYFTMTGARIYTSEQQVKANEQIIIPNSGFKFNGTIFYKVSIDGMIKTGKIIGIK